MSLNSFTVKKFLLTAGLLIVLGQGLWQLPELQDYLFPVENVELILSQTTLNKRVDYLKWFQAHNGPDQKVSADRLLAFPFSECIRPLAPRYFWHINIRLAQKTRVKVERNLRRLDTLLKSNNEDFRMGLSHDSPAIPAKPAALSGSMKQIQQFQNRCNEYNAKLMELTNQLTWLENNDYKN